MFHIQGLGGLLSVLLFRRCMLDPLILNRCRYGFAATGNILVTRASYRNILAVNPAPKPTQPKITSVVDSYITHFLLVETEKGFDNGPKIHYC